MKRFNSKPIICIIDDEEMILSLLERVLGEKYEVKSFYKIDDLLNYEHLSDSSLFILDINLEMRMSGIELSNHLYSLGHRQPRLFMSGMFDDNSFDLLVKDIIVNNYTFDFISKPIKMNNLKNRVNILIDIFKYQILLEFEKDKSIQMLWDMLNHSLLFVVLIDKDFNIKLANYALSKELGYDNERELIGKNWLKFADPTLQDTIKKVHDDIAKGEEKFKEFTYAIYSKDGKSTKVKWFNSYANSNLNLSVGIGTPYRNIKPDESIDTIRSYFRDIIEQDSTVIQAMKETIIQKKYAAV